MRFLHGLISLSVLVLWGCGQSATTRLTTSNRLPSTVSTDNGCGLSFRVEVAVLSPAPLLTNTPVRFQLSASFCPTSEFGLAGAGAAERFTSTKVIEKTFNNPGTFTEVFSVLAYETAGAGEAVDFQVATKELTVVAPPTAPPPPVPAPSCQIARLPNTPVTVANGAMQVQIATQGVVTGLTLNGVPAPAGVPLSLSPVVANSGIYLGQVLVTGPGGGSSCALNFQVPTCVHRVTSAVLAATGDVALTTKTTLNGVFNNVRVDLVDVPPAQFPVAPATELTLVRSDLPFVSGNRLTQASVSNALGDSAQCSAEYSTPYDFTIALQNPVNYSYVNGILTNGENTRAMAAAGAGAQTTWRMGEGRASRPILDSSAAVQRFMNCGADEVVVGHNAWSGPGDDAGRTNAMNTLACRKLLPFLKLVNSSSHSITWTYNVYVTCPAGKVMVGNAYVGAASYTVHCAQPVQR